jgi:hypothetical protein
MTASCVSRNVSETETGLTRIRFPLLYIFPVPLSDTRSASVSKHQSSNALEGSNLSVSINGRSDLFGTRGNSELALDRQATVSSLLSNGSRTCHILIRRIRAGADQCDFELVWPVIFLDLLSKLRNGSG